tara:strand:- start:141 stop:1772 length:1632 start_codon:yes stop_codon:yes gene_type:complete
MEKEILELYNLIKNKNIEKAYSVCKKLYRTNKNNKNIVKVMAYLFIQKSQYHSAMDILENFYHTGSIDKDFDYYINMGVCKKSVEDYEESIYMYEQATNIDSGSPLCYMVPAEIYLKLRDFKKSMELVDKALNNIKDINVGNVHFANAIKLKTEIHVALNQDKENEDMLMGILANDFYPDIFYLLSNVNKELIDEKLLFTAKKQLEEYDNKYENRIKRFWYVHPIYFGLAIYYNNKDKKKSEDFYEIGNKEIMNSLRYNSFEYQKDIVKIIDCFEEKILKENDSEDLFGENNFFILGTPRSGTTLIESFIASNNEVTSGGELLSARDLIYNFTQNFENKDVDLFFDEFRKIYLKRTDYLRGNHRKIVDKLPDNFLYVGFLNKILPKSKIIRTFRNPWDVAISLFKQRYVTNIPYSASFFNIGVFMANFEAINIYWNKSVIKKDNILDIKYEELVEDPEYYQKKIYDFLEINSEFDEEKRKAFFSHTASMRQIGSGVHKKSVSKDEFVKHKDEFYESLEMQRKYWQKMGLFSVKGDFFGYSINS